MSNSTDTSPTISGSDARADWSAAAEACLIQYYKDAKAQGKMSDNNFKPAVHTAAAAFLKTKGFSFTKSQCSSRWSRFKAEFKVVKTLRGLSGFGWDDMRKMVVAEDKVWDAYLAGHKTARPFRKRGFPHYDDLAEMIGDTHAIGATALSSTQAIAPAATSQPSTTSSQASTQQEEEEGEEAEEDDEDSQPATPPTNGSKRRSAAVLTTEPPPKRVRPTPSSAAMSSIASSVGALTEAVASGSLFTGGPSDTPQKKKAAFDKVAASEGLSPISLAKARRVFRGPGELAREYLSFDDKDEQQVEARRIWLHDEIDNLY